MKRGPQPGEKFLEWRPTSLDIGNWAGSTPQPAKVAPKVERPPEPVRPDGRLTLESSELVYEPVDERASKPLIGASLFYGI